MGGLDTRKQCRLLYQRQKLQESHVEWDTYRKRSTWNSAASGLRIIAILLLFSCSVMSDSWQPHELQHARLPCPSPSTGACTNSCTLSQWRHPTISSSGVPFSFNLLSSIFPSIRVFSIELVLCIRWPKYESFSFTISPYNEDSVLISFRIDWFDLAYQRTLKSLLHYHSSKPSILWCSAFFIAQLSHPNMTTGKAIVLTMWTFVNKVMPLLFNTLSRLVIAFLPRSKHVLILWPQSPSVVILKPPKMKSVTVSIVSPSICHEVIGQVAMIFVFWMLSFKPAFSLSHLHEEVL